METETPLMSRLSDNPSGIGQHSDVMSLGVMDLFSGASVFQLRPSSRLTSGSLLHERVRNDSTVRCVLIQARQRVIVRRSPVSFEFAIALSS